MRLYLKSTYNFIIIIVYFKLRFRALKELTKHPKTRTYDGHATPENKYCICSNSLIYL